MTPCLVAPAPVLALGLRFATAEHDSLMERIRAPLRGLVAPGGWGFESRSRRNGTSGAVSMSWTTKGKEKRT